jgi:HPt (histidine-containing phosphotransfer) domain-containing protein
VIEDLRKRFLPRFVQTARERVTRALLCLETPRGASAAVADLHALAGEAAILELFDIAGLAREGEKAARRVVTAGASTGTPSESAVECARVLHAIEAAIDTLV